jgi:hypothetical protein
MDSRSEQGNHNPKVGGSSPSRLPRLTLDDDELRSTKLSGTKIGLKSNRFKSPSAGELPCRNSQRLVQKAPSNGHSDDPLVSR